MQLKPRWVIKDRKSFHARGADPEARVISSWWTRRETKIGPGFGAGGTGSGTSSSMASSLAVPRVFTFLEVGGCTGSWVAPVEPSAFTPKWRVGSSSAGGERGEAGACRCVDVGAVGSSVTSQGS